MKEACYFIGNSEAQFLSKKKYPEEGKSILLRPEQIEQQRFKENIFLSLDMDVFHPMVTIANRGYKWGTGEMFPDEIKWTYNQILPSKNLVGINIAEYLPLLDLEYSKGKSSPTIELIVDIIKPLIS